MKSLWLRMNAAVCLALIVGGCSTETVAPAGPMALVVAAPSRAVQIASPGGSVAAAPAVEVRDPAGVPVPDVYVSFAVSLGGGALTKTLVKSDSHGIASSAAWTLGADGANQVIASLEGGPSLAFDAYAINLPTGSDSYDLVSRGGQPIPGSFGGGADPFMVLAGRLALDADATYNSVYVRYRPSTHVFSLEAYHGAYWLSGTQLTFADYPVGISATGVLQADMLTLRSGDPDVVMQENVFVRATVAR
jgi:hypothetical protein